MDLQLPHLVPTWLPPSREHWETVSTLFSYFPLFSTLVWFVPWFPMGKRSVISPFNVPGKIGWFIMELPGPLIVLYCMLTVSPTTSLPWANWTMAGMYITHYVYRAIIYPLMQPTMSPMHVVVPLSAIAFNIMNGISLGGWLAGYGPTTTLDWAGRLYEIQIGMVIWGWSLLAVMFHDDDLREIRRSALRRQREQEEKDGTKGKGVQKFYMVPKNGLFHFILYPHYVCEWIEWAGFWLVGGWACVPARSFLLAEVSSMLPQAIKGREWYVEKFGEEKLAGKRAVIPGLL